MRSAVHHAGAQSTATLQPFFSLQLDIQVIRVMLGALHIVDRKCEGGGEEHPQISQQL
jgi:hypothetical protein